MIGKKRNNAVGVKGRSGRRPYHQEMAYFKKLDAVLPKVIDYLISLVDEGMISGADKQTKELAVKAANILNSKAPERIRHSGDEDNPIRLVVDC